MKLLQLCLGSAAIILAYSNQVNAAAPTFDNWTVTNSTISSSSSTCVTGYTCGTALTDLGFYQRMLNESSTGITYFQTIITESDSSPSDLTTTVIEPPAPPAFLICPDGYICGDTITGPDFLQMELTDGSNILFTTSRADTDWFTATDNSLPGPTPLRLFHTQTDLKLKPGQYLISAFGAALAGQVANLNLDRSKLTADPAYLELNQQSAVEQKIYRNIVDVEIAGVTAGADAKLAAQLNTPLNIPDGYELRMRVLTTQGWADFVSDDHNHLTAAAKLDSGYCPEVGSTLYQTSFDAGSECLQLTLQDGGANDGDGDADGTIALTTGPVLKTVELVPEPVTTTVDSASRPGEATGYLTTSEGGGGAWSWWLSLALLFQFGRFKQMRG
jgi:hypothetical protein